MQSRSPSARDCHPLIRSFAMRTRQGTSARAEMRMRVGAGRACGSTVIIIE